MSKNNITVIGTGALGSTLLKALDAHGFSIKSIFNRTEEKANKLAEELGVSTSGPFPKDVEELGSLTLITVPDGAIEKVANQLAELEGSLSGKYMVHCSGNESASVLKSLKEKGAVVASFHPLQTFSEASDPNNFNGIYFSLQGDSEAFSGLKEIANALGSQTEELTAGQKSNLHASAVMASNYLITLLSASASIAEEAGMNKAIVLKMLLPLVKTTGDNAATESPEHALSGPVKRADFKTVDDHLQLLESVPDIKKLYAELGKYTAKIARSTGSLSDAELDEMLKLLNEKF